MQWYAHYPGDYGRDTAHLSMIEDGAYRRLLDHYYSTGAALPNDLERLCRVCRAFEAAERQAMETVLSQFFVLDSDGYHNARADRELAKRSEQKSKLSESGRRGAKRRWNNPTGSDGQVSSHPNGQASSLSIARPQPQPEPEQVKEGSAPKDGAPAAPAGQRPSPCAFSGDYLAVSEEQDRLLGDAFPWVDRQAEYRKANCWLEAHPNRRPKRQGAFLHNWFSRIESPSMKLSGGVNRAEQRTRNNLAAAGFPVH